MTTTGSLARRLTLTIIFLGFAAPAAPAAPKIVFSTLLGGEGVDGINALAIDASKRAFALSCSRDPDGYAGGAVSLSPAAGLVDIVVTRLNKAGRFERSVTFGGSEIEACLAIAVGPDPRDAGSTLVYVLGATFSRDFPTRNPIQARCAGTGPCPGNLTITVLDADLTEILFSTYLGGSDGELPVFFLDYGGDLAVDADGRIALVGATESKKYPKRRPTQKRAKGDTKAVVSVLEPLPDGGYELSFSTFLGARVKNRDSHARAVAFGPDGLLVVAGSTDDRRFPAVAPLQNGFGGGFSDGFVTVYDLDGASATAPATRAGANGKPSLLFSTIFGGRDFDELYDVAVDGSRVYVTGVTLSDNFPTQNSFQPALGGIADAVLMVLDLEPTLASGEAPEVVVSSFFGGRFVDEGAAIAVDRRGVVHLTGTTFSRDFPTRSAVQGQCAQHPSATPDCWDGYVTRFNPIQGGGPPTLKFSSFLGGPQVGTLAGGEVMTAIAVDRTGASYVGGRTGSSRFPTKRAAQKRFRGVVEGCLTKVKK